MITKTDISLGPGKGKLAKCNICGKEAPYMSLPRHVEANHLEGVSHSCNICGAISRSKNGLRRHKYGFHSLTLLRWKLFRTRNSLRMHISSHHWIWFCRSKHGLRQHYIKHKNDAWPEIKNIIEKDFGIVTLSFFVSFDSRLKTFNSYLLYCCQGR